MNKKTHVTLCKLRQMARKHFGFTYNLSRFNSTNSFQRKKNCRKEFSIVHCTITSMGNSIACESNMNLSMKFWHKCHINAHMRVCNVIAMLSVLFFLLAQSMCERAFHSSYVPSFSIFLSCSHTCMHSHSVAQSTQWLLLRQGTFHLTSRKHLFWIYSFGTKFYFRQIDHVTGFVFLFSFELTHFSLNRKRTNWNFNWFFADLFLKSFSKRNWRYFVTWMPRHCHTIKWTPREEQVYQKQP